ncbi:ABC transporter permease [Blautia obeum]|mgnify:FL=1|jgi:ribose/xylose/arabinose/galactoside ABC-type transport system permease subunit|uniref:ABC transporter permease n=1 Tax=Blautia obeum TaxID=40520 RepID=A0A414K833_9FIRM|nr:ABC transporter permease [Blautia obeum]RGZ07956.1 ABC transporter permease [Blautia obeum]RHE15643.1 ABC transporter permease [Blautia obeum]RHE70967.1 ABC transporter permease [Blautia obeum]RHM29296.1 ABC transporter permease [Blautia obeum]
METKSFDLKKFLMKYVMYLFLILMCIVLTIASDKFLTLTNLMTIIKQISIQSIVAIGMTMIIISGNIDLSVGSLVALCSVSCAMLMNKGLPTIIAVLAAVIIGAFAGFITGGVTAKLKLHSFLVTLALMTALRGLAQTLTNGRPVAGLPSSFGKVASGTVGPVPLLVIYMIVLYAIFMYVMKYTAFGRSIYAVGSNQESARLSGINIEKVKTLVFILSGALCGIAGVLLTAKVRSGDPTCANAWEMDTIAGAIIGGTDMNGGEGKLGGTIIGLLFVGILANGMVLLGVSAYMQSVIKGLVIFMAVIINSIQKRSQG